MKKKETVEERFRKRFDWQKIHLPRVWNPRQAGEELAGYYGGTTKRNGSFGQYDVVIVHVPYRGSYVVSGTEVIQLVDTSMIRKGHPVRIVFKGREEYAPKKEKKHFELLVAEGDPLAEDELPVLRT